MKVREGLINKKYKIGKQIGEGAFGEIFSGNKCSLLIGINVETAQEVAIKLV